MAALAWHLAVEGSRPGAENMALDHAMALSVGSDRGLVRFYRWSRPTVSLGRNEPAVGRYDLRTAAEMGLSFVRRPTGGRAVLHDEELTYAVAAPLRALDGVRAAYTLINDALLAGLRSMGVTASMATGMPPLDPGAGPCFAGPADGEIIVGRRKIVGSAQVRLGAALLQHGSVLLAGDQERLARIRTGASEVEGTEGGAVTLAEALGRTPSWEEVASALARGLHERWPHSWTGGALPEDVLRRARELTDRYASPEWTWRR